MELTFILIWAGCAVLAYLVAPDDKKGLGVVLGIFLGVIGVAIAAILKGERS